MFSGRVVENREPSAYARSVDNERKRWGSVIDLSGANPTTALFDFYADCDPDIFADAGVFHYAPEPFGPLALRETIAGGYYKTIGASVEPDRIVCAASTSEAYSWLFKLLCNAGDDVLVAAPGYPLVSQIAALESVQVHTFPLTYIGGRWVIDMERLRVSFGTRTRAVCVVSNPVGSYLHTDEVCALGILCAEFHCALIVDEVFFDYRSSTAANSSVIGSAAIHDDCLTFTLQGFSKMLCMPQLKLGWMTVSGPRDLCDEALSRLSFIADAFLPVNAAVALAAPRLLSLREIIQREVCERLKKNEAMLRSVAGADTFEVLGREGGWNACIRIGVSAEKAATYLVDECAVIVQPGFLYDFREDTMLVLSLLTEEGLFCEGMARIVVWLKKLDTTMESPVTP